MMRCLSRWTLLMVLVAFPQLGCATASGIVPPALEWKAAGAGASAPQDLARDELPPQQGAELRMAYARRLEEQGLYREAAYHFEKVREASPRTPGLSRKLAVLYDRLNENQKALAEYQAALKENAKDADLLNDLGFFYYQRQDWAEAEKWLRQSLAVNGRHPRATVNLGMTVAQQGRLQEAYHLFTQVVRPGEAYSNLGVLLAQQGRYEEAGQHLRKALQLDPGLKQAQSALTALEHQSHNERADHQAALASAAAAASLETVPPPDHRPTDPAGEIVSAPPHASPKAASPPPGLEVTKTIPIQVQKAAVEQ